MFNKRTKHIETCVSKCMSMVYTSINWQLFHEILFNSANITLLRWWLWGSKSVSWTIKINVFKTGSIRLLQLVGLLTIDFSGLVGWNGSFRGRTIIEPSESPIRLCNSPVSCVPVNGLTKNEFPLYLIKINDKNIGNYIYID